MFCGKWFGVTETVVPIAKPIENGPPEIYSENPRKSSRISNHLKDKIEETAIDTTNSPNNIPIASNIENAVLDLPILTTIRSKPHKQESIIPSSSSLPGDISTGRLNLPSFHSLLQLSDSIDWVSVPLLDYQRELWGNGILNTGRIWLCYTYNSHESKQSVYVNDDDRVMCNVMILTLEGEMNDFQQVQVAMSAFIERLKAFEKVLEAELSGTNDLLAPSLDYMMIFTDILLAAVIHVLRDTPLEVSQLIGFVGILSDLCFTQDADLMFLAPAQREASLLAYSHGLVKQTQCLALVVTLTEQLLFTPSSSNMKKTEDQNNTFSLLLSIMGFLERLLRRLRRFADLVSLDSPYYYIVSMRLWQQTDRVCLILRALISPEMHYSLSQRTDYRSSWLLWHQKLVSLLFASTATPEDLLKLLQKLGVKHLATALSRPSQDEEVNVCSLIADSALLEDRQLLPYTEERSSSRMLKNEMEKNIGLEGLEVTPNLLIAGRAERLANQGKESLPLSLRFFLLSVLRYMYVYTAPRLAESGFIDHGRRGLSIESSHFSGGYRIPTMSISSSTSTTSLRLNNGSAAKYLDSRNLPSAAQLFLSLQEVLVFLTRDVFTVTTLSSQRKHELEMAPLLAQLLLKLSLSFFRPEEQASSTTVPSRFATNNSTSDERDVPMWVYGYILQSVQSLNAILRKKAVLAAQTARSFTAAKTARSMRSISSMSVRSHLDGTLERQQTAAWMTAQNVSYTCVDDNQSVASPMTLSRNDSASAAVLSTSPINFLVGDVVDGRCTLPNGSERWFPGKIESVNSDGTLDIRFDDGDLGANKSSEKVRHSKRRGRSAGTSVTGPATPDTLTRNFSVSPEPLQLPPLQLHKSPSLPALFAPLKSASPRGLGSSVGRHGEWEGSPLIVGEVGTVEEVAGDEDDGDDDDAVIVIPSVLGDRQAGTGTRMVPLMALDGLPTTSSGVNISNNSLSGALLRESSTADLTALVSNASSNGIPALASLRHTSYGNSNGLFATDTSRSRLSRGGNGGDISARSVNGSFRPLLPTLEGHHQPPPLRATGSEFFSTSNSVLLTQSWRSTTPYVPGEDLEEETLAVLTATYLPLALVLLRRVFTQRGFMDLEFCSYLNFLPSRNGAQGCNGVPSSPCGGTPMSLRKGGGPGDDASGEGEDVTLSPLRALFHLREFLDLCGTYVPLADAALITSHLHDEATSRCLRLLSGSFWEGSCLASHLDEADAYRLGEGGFGCVYSVSCPPTCGLFHSTGHCLDCYRSAVAEAPKRVVVLNEEKKTSDKFCGVVGAYRQWVTRSVCRATCRCTERGLSSSRKVAIKRVPRERSEHDVAHLVVALTEVQCLEILRSHVGVCFLEGYGVASSEYCLAMEQGTCTLSEWRTNTAVSSPSRRAPGVDLNSADELIGLSLSLSDVHILLLLFADISRIIAGVHSEDIAHFDIKAANFLFRRRYSSELGNPSSLATVRMDSPQFASMCTGEELSSTGCRPLDNLRYLLREAVMRGVVSGEVALSDFGEALAYISCYGSDHPLRQRSRGTLAIHSPEMLAVSHTQRIAKSGRKENLSLRDVLTRPFFLHKPSMSIPRNMNLLAVEDDNTVVGTSAPQSSMGSPPPAGSSSIPSTTNMPDQRSDLWSLGCLLCELICGELIFSLMPFGEQYAKFCLAQSELFSRNLNGELRVVEDVCRRLPDDVKDGILDLIRGLMAREPDARISLSDVLTQTKTLVLLVEEHIYAKHVPSNDILPADETTQGVNVNGATGMKLPLKRQLSFYGSDEVLVLPTIAPLALAPGVFFCSSAWMQVALLKARVKLPSVGVATPTNVGTGSSNGFDLKDLSVGRQSVSRFLTLGKETACNLWIESSNVFSPLQPNCQTLSPCLAVADLISDAGADQFVHDVVLEALVERLTCFSYRTDSSSTSPGPDVVWVELLTVTEPLPSTSEGKDTEILTGRVELVELPLDSLQPFVWRFQLRLQLSSFDAEAVVVALGQVEERLHATANVSPLIFLTHKDDEGVSRLLRRNLSTSVSEPDAATSTIFDAFNPPTKHLNGIQHDDNRAGPRVAKALVCIAVALTVALLRHQDVTHDIHSRTENTVRAVLDQCRMLPVLSTATNDPVLFELLSRIK